MGKTFPKSGKLFLLLCKFFPIDFSYKMRKMNLFFGNSLFYEGLWLKKISFFESLNWHIYCFLKSREESVNMG